MGQAPGPITGPAKPAPDTGPIPPSVADQAPAHQPVERAGSRAVPGPPGASWPRAVEGPGRCLHPLHVAFAEPALVNGSATGFAAVRGPDTLLRHGYRPSPPGRRAGPRITDSGHDEPAREETETSIGNVKRTPSLLRMEEGPLAARIALLPGPAVSCGRRSGFLARTDYVFLRKARSDRRVFLFPVIPPSFTHTRQPITADSEIQPLPGAGTGQQPCWISWDDLL